MQEIWKDIEDYEGLYQVSDVGRVRSLDRYVHHSCGGKAKLKGIIKRLTPDKDGYLLVGLSGNGEKPTAGKVHRLVAISFIENPENKPTINHKDGDKSNNHKDNVEWATRSENTRHAIDSKLLKLEMPIIQLSLRGDFINEYKSLTNACDRTGANKSTVSMVCNNRRGRVTANGYKWIYKKDYNGIKNNG